MPPDAAFAKPSRGRRALWLAAKLLVTGAACAFIFTRQPLADLWTAARSLSPTAFLLATAIQLAAVVVGTARFSLLLQAYGALGVPRFVPLLKLYLVGQFYNTYLPGGVGGDLLRGLVTRRAFGERGATSAVAVVLIERVLGLAGLLCLSSLAVLLVERDLFGGLLPYASVGLVGVLVGVFVLTRLHQLARFAPGPLRRLLAPIPRLARPACFAGAALLSLVTHALVAACGHVLIHSIQANVPWTSSFVAMPVAAAAGFFPLTVAGAGARDLVLIQLYEMLGVPRAVGTATAFAFLGSTLLSAAVGGIVQLLAPLELGTDAWKEPTPARPLRDPG